MFRRNQPDIAYAVILVYSTGHALQVERLLNRASIANKMIPVPRHLSSDCGSCVRIRQADLDAARAALDSAQVEVQGIHCI